MMAGEIEEVEELDFLVHFEVVVLVLLVVVVHIEVVVEFDLVALVVVLVE
ncbi:hypothetical protein A2U01_0075586, partial [Trifolium medium]|nr:hypothetical protein [Trifolium medium]